MRTDTVHAIASWYWDAECSSPGKGLGGATLAALGICFLYDGRCKTSRKLYFCFLPLFFGNSENSFWISFRYWKQVQFRSFLKVKWCNGNFWKAEDTCITILWSWGEVADRWRMAEQSDKKVVVPWLTATIMNPELTLFQDFLFIEVTILKTVYRLVWVFFCCKIFWLIQMQNCVKISVSFLLYSLESINKDLFSKRHLFGE